MSERVTERWRSRPVGASIVRAGVFLAPVVFSVVTSITVVRAIPRAPGTLNLSLRWGAAFVVSTIAFRIGDRVVRRFLPLAVLLRLSLAFPDGAPNRLKLARQAASTRDLRALVERAHASRRASEPALAAAEILALVSAVEAHDRGTRGHSERVRVYTDMLADELRLHKRDRDRLRWAALLHDVGKITVPHAILNKPGKPDPEEWVAIQRHPAEGARLTATLRGWLGAWAPAIEQHHERWDGMGYPAGLSGEQISYAARIVAVADSYETMTARRPYRRPLRAAQARAELVRCSGSQFDPAIVRAFLAISVRRLERVGGPLSWLAQTPLIRGVEQATTSGAAAVGGTALALGIAPAPIVAPELPEKPPAITSPAPRESRAPDPSISAKPTVVASPTPRPTPSASPTPKVSPSPSPSPTGTRTRGKPPTGPTRRPSTEPSTIRTPLPSALPSPEP